MDFTHAANIGEGYHPDPAPNVIYCCLEDLRYWSWPDLSAPHWRWYWNDRPGASITVGSERLPLRPDRIILIPPYTSFSSSMARPVKHLFIHFTLPWNYNLPVPRPLIRRPGEVELGLIREFGSAT